MYYCMLFKLVIMVFLLSLQKSLVGYLEKLKVCSNIEGVHDIIPANVCLENYVSLRLVMRRWVYHW